MPVIRGTADGERLEDTDGDDTILAGGGGDVLFQSEGDDVVRGGAGDDIIYDYDSDAGSADLLVAGDGNDTISSRYAPDQSVTIDGGAGVDRLFFGVFGTDDRVVRIDLSAAQPIMPAGVTVVGVEELYYGGDDQIDVVTGASGDDKLNGALGDDRLNGWLGDDFLSGGGGDDRLAGGDGDDHLLGFRDDDDLHGGKGDDRLAGGAGADAVFGDGGDDVISWALAEESVEAGGDVMNGGAGVDLIDLDLRSAGDDAAVAIDMRSNQTIAADLPFGASFIGMERISIIGGSGDDVVMGGDWSDTILGGAGANTLSGGGGDDVVGFTIVAGASGAGSLDGGDGVDTLALTIAADDAAADIDLTDNQTVPGTAPDGTTFVGFEKIDFKGGGAGDSVTGGRLSDTLSGGDGSDTLDGGAGADTIIGGAGVDLITGGDGADLFQFYRPRPADRDIVTDFNSAEGDRLRFSADEFRGMLRNPDGSILDRYFTFGSEATAGHSQFFYDVDNQTLYFDFDGTGERPAQAVARLLFAGGDPDDFIHASDILIG